MVADALAEDLSFTRNGCVIIMIMMFCYDERFEKKKRMTRVNWL